MTTAAYPKVSKPKATAYAVDWPAFDAAARARGAHRLQAEQAAVPALPPEAPKRAGRGKQLKYADDTVRAMLILAVSGRLSLRETEGYVLALRDEAGYDWDVPDHTTLCRRMKRLDVEVPPMPPGARLVFLVDSTGLKLSGPGEWRGRHPRSGKAEAEGAGSSAKPADAVAKPPRRKWCKAHLAVEAFSGRIVAATLTDGDAADGPMLPQVLADQPLAGAFVCADGAYHHEAEFRFVHGRGARLLARPPYNAALWNDQNDEPAIRWRNAQIAQRNALGQQAWAIQSGYSHRSLIEAHNARFKHYTGAQLRCRDPVNRQVELALRVQLVNHYQLLWHRAGGTPAQAIH